MEALRHSSFVNEQTDPYMRNNERFEFLGDAVLNLVIGHLLMQHYPDLKEGELSRMRSGLVNEKSLAKIARDLNLGDYIQLGKGELRTKGHKKKSILADAFEALAGALYLDAGFDTAYQKISARFSALLESTASLKDNRDYKSRLQERVQEHQNVVPLYTLIESSGPDHDKTFLVQVRVDSLTATAEGKTKKSAEQKAARKMFKQLCESY